MKKKKMIRKFNKKLTEEAMQMRLDKFLKRLEKPEIKAVFQRLKNK